MEPITLDLTRTALLGLGLSASSGFRVFIPPLMLSIAALWLHLPLPPELQWMGTTAAFFVLLIAAIFEIGAYYIPWLDNALDSIAVPAAILAGTVISAGFFGVDDPVLKWTLGLVAGGGLAGGIQLLTSTSRLTSLATTAGFANPLIATFENLFAVGLSLLSIVMLAIALVLLSGTVVLLYFAVKTVFKKTPPASEQTPLDEG